ncbi:MAG: hypothetical protein RR373_08760, partial [Akkermansia sp.]
ESSSFIVVDELENVVFGYGAFGAFGVMAWVVVAVIKMHRDDRDAFNKQIAERDAQNKSLIDED